jgi:hypothetical protein
MRPRRTDDFYRDLSPASINLASVHGEHTYLITGGTGAFAGVTGVGTGTVQVNPLTLQYVDATRFVIPLPSTLALLALGVALLAARVRHRGAAAPG